MPSQSTCVLLCAAALLLFACGSREEEGPVQRQDLGQDTRPDTTPDVTPDIPTDAQPEGFTIHDIQDVTSDEHPADNSTVTVSGVVTAVDREGTSGSFYIQDPAGGPYSGIYVYNQGGSTVDITDLQVGQTVEVTGNYTEYYDLSEIQVSSYTVTNATPTPLDPATVNPADVATGGGMAEAYEGVLVQVIDVAVTALLDYGQFEVTGGLAIDDDLYDFATPAVGYEFDRLAGVLTYGFGAVQLNPRDEDDWEGEEIQPNQYSISEIQDDLDPNHPAANSEVTVTGVVTAIDTYQRGTNPTTINHFWIQEPTGGPYSGILIYNQYRAGAYAVDIAGLEVGDTVEVTGTYQEYYDLSEIEPSSFEITDNATSPPTAEVVSAADVATGGDHAEEYEGVLVTVQSVSVTTPNDDTALRQYGQVEVTGGLVIDDELMEIDPLPSLGTAYTSITGVLTYSFEAVQLLPRSAADIVAQ